MKKTFRVHFPLLGHWDPHFDARLVAKHAPTGPEWEQKKKGSPPSGTGET